MSRIKERNYPNRRLTELRKNGLLKIDLSYSHVEAITNKLAHYEDLEEQGRLIELPMPLGKPYYEIKGSDKISEFPLRPASAGRIIQNGLFGETVFLTKEEAMAKLEELREGAE